MRRHILCIGDSNTHGYCADPADCADGGDRFNEDERWTCRLQAALDVFEKEPLPADSDLWDCPGLLITPHAAGNMTLPYTRERIVELFLEDFENYCEGRPLLRQVSLSKGY